MSLLCKVGKQKRKATWKGMISQKRYCNLYFFFSYKQGVKMRKIAMLSLGNYECKSIVSHIIHLSKLLWCPNLKEKEILFETNCKMQLSKSNICLRRQSFRRKLYNKGKGGYRILYWLEMEGLTLNTIYCINITMPLKVLREAECYTLKYVDLRKYNFYILESQRKYW